MNITSISPGKPRPLGAVIKEKGTQFAVFSRHASSVSLLLFDKPDDTEPVKEIKLDPEHHKTGDIWHIQIDGIGAGTFYLYRVDGPFEPMQGHRFNKHKLLLDPYAKALTGGFPENILNVLAYDPDSPEKDLSVSTEQDVGTLPKCIVIDDSFDWQGDKPLNYPLQFCVIYETHVRGFTKHESSGISHPGTYRGVIEKIPYLKELGITSLELLPIQEFNEHEIPYSNPETGKRLKNYWGYSTISFFAPKASYSSSGRDGQQVTEFKEMVRELHKAGIEVILDIVFNHSGEGNELGPTFCFRGLDNKIYYILDENPRYYKDYSGCGNTLNCNHPVLRTLIRQCLHYWVVEMHVDGFRFDLGSILGRDREGTLMDNPPTLEGIAEDPILRNTKLIAEAWDAGGAYQVGSFPGGRWAEWNDKYRDNVRSYWRGDEGSVPGLATRLSGSSDLYLRDGRKPFHSINFITSHDGFTMNDLVSYSKKHNEMNGEGNRDGHSHTVSSNYGIEGETDDPEINRIRTRQIKNFASTLLVSHGVPMLLGGDEFRRTQKGNNNAYCQDNKVSWFDWILLEKNREIFRFSKEMIAFRKNHPAFSRTEFFKGKDANFNAIPDITWYDHRGRISNWQHTTYYLALRLDGSKTETLADRDDNDFFIMFNSSQQNKRFKLCSAPARKKWYRVVDTSMPSPEDFLSEGEELFLENQSYYTVGGRSLVLLISK